MIDFVPDDLKVTITAPFFAVLLLGLVEIVFYNIICDFFFEF